MQRRKEDLEDLDADPMCIRSTPPAFMILLKGFLVVAPVRTDQQQLRGEFINSEHHHQFTLSVSVFGTTIGGAVSGSSFVMALAIGPDSRLTNASRRSLGQVDTAVKTTPCS